MGDSGSYLMRWDEVAALFMLLGLAALLAWQWWFADKTGSLFLRWSSVKRANYPGLFEVLRWGHLFIAGGLVLVVIYIIAVPQP